MFPTCLGRVSTRAQELPAEEKKAAAAEGGEAAAAAVGEAAGGEAAPAKAEGAEGAEGEAEEEEDEDKELEPPPPAYREEDGEKVPLPGCFSLFVTDKTKELVGADDLGPGEGQTLYKEVAKDVIMEDIRFRGAISDFKDWQKHIEKADSDTILLRDNDDDTFGDGNNLEICCLAASAAILLANRDYKVWLKKKEEEEKNAKKPGAKKKKKKKKKKPKPESKPWVSLGSEAEIAEETVGRSRDLIVVTMVRSKVEFNQPIKFSDKDAHEMWNSSQMECRPFKDPNFELKRLEQNKGVQAMPVIVETGVQATSGRKQNGSTQYAPRTMGEAEKAEALGSEGMKEFINAAFETCETALQQNEITDISEDHFSILTEDDAFTASKGENSITEFQSFTDLVYSKGKVVSSIDWIPGKEGVVAVSCSEPISFNQRLEIAGHARTSAVLIWNFSDPIHPQYVLESPFDVFSFRFNPLRPDVIAGGLYNGQICLWDTTHEHNRIHKVNKGEGEDSTVPVIKPKFLSSLEKSHHTNVTDLVWLREGVQVNKYGQIVKQEGEPKECNFFVTTGSDGRVMFWDIRVKKETKRGKEGEIDWKPVWMVSLARDAGGDFASCRFSFNLKAPFQSTFFAGSMDGEVSYAQYEKPAGVDHPEYTKSCTEAHCGPVVALHRSSFAEDIVLSVGDWTFKIFKEGYAQPLFSSDCASTYLTAGAWSPTRPGVAYIARQDGVIEVWDFLDRSHEASMFSTVSSNAITSLEFFPDPHVSQMLAVGDSTGTLHIMELPRNLLRQQPNEQAIMKAFFEREIERLEHVERYSAARDEAQKDKKDKTAADGEPGGAEDAGLEDAGLLAGLSDEDEYLALESEFRAKMEASGAQFS